MLDWIIVGGGVHGVHLARALSRAGRSVRICDPAPTLLEQWNRCAAAVGMTHLRSPIDHDLDAEELSLHHYAEARIQSSSSSVSAGWFVGRRRCPSLELFAHHAAWVCTRGRLDALHERAWVEGLVPTSAGVRVETDRGRLDARRVVLALGQPKLARPAWAAALERGGPALHPFDPRFDPQLEPGTGGVVVVGAGLSAVQLALRWARRRPGEVCLVGRRPPAITEFDADFRWARSRRVAQFGRLPVAGRRSVLRSARRRGTVPPWVARRLARALERGHLRWRAAEVVAASPAKRGVVVELDDGERMDADRLACATGFDDSLRGVELLDTLAEQLGLARDELGVPIVDGALRWHPRVHVSGKLAEHALGPMAPNIVGARLASRRLLRAFAA